MRKVIAEKLHFDLKNSQEDSQAFWDDLVLDFENAVSPLNIDEIYNIIQVINNIHHHYKNSQVLEVCSCRECIQNGLSEKKNIYI